MFLDDGEDRGDRHGEAQNHVEGDEEFVQFAFANEGSGIVPAAKKINSKSDLGIILSFALPVA